jgi:hypothetical protein
MRRRACCLGASFVGLLVAVACGSSPASPTSTGSTTTTGLTTSIGAPTPVTPANSASIANSAQPVTLVAQNAVLGQPGTPVYKYEVATDAAFASVVQTKDGVAQGSNGQTTVQLDPLSAAKDYYWHVRATAGGTTGVYGTVYKFTIGPPVSISAPVPVSPLNGSGQNLRPSFIVADAGITGPAGPITYKYEIADNTAFSPVLITATVAETPTQTTFIPSSDLPTGKTLYWRATAIDQTNSVSSSPSATQSFTCAVPTAASNLAAQEGFVLWPNAQPPGAPGHAALGDGWGVGILHDFQGNAFLNPLLDALRVFDLLDRGMSPDGAIAWLQMNGYGTTAAYYPAVAVIGFPQEYMALTVNGNACGYPCPGGVWDMVKKAGA